MFSGFPAHAISAGIAHDRRGRFLVLVPRWRREHCTSFSQDFPWAAYSTSVGLKISSSYSFPCCARDISLRSSDPTWLHFVFD